MLKERYWLLLRVEILLVRRRFKYTYFHRTNKHVAYTYIICFYYLVYLLFLETMRWGCSL